VILMASTKQLSANKKNGVRSRGSRSAAGKARSSRNAFRHGLTANTPIDSRMRPEAERLALAIAGPNAGSARLAHAWTIAETQFDLLQIRNAQIELMESACAVPSVASEMPGERAFSGEILLGIIPQLFRWHDYERKILSRLKRATRAFVFHSQL
jgi:hypothetical protein